MKVVFFILLLFQYAYVLSQDLINPYLDYDGASVTDLYYNSSTINHSANTIPLIHNYNGEYEFLLDKFPWGNQGLISTLSGIDLNDFALSYQIELVSFPFTVDCFFIPSITP